MIDWFIAILYIIGVMYVGIRCYDIGYMDGWDKGIRHWK